MIICNLCINCYRKIDFDQEEYEAYEIRDIININLTILDQRNISISNQLEPLARVSSRFYGDQIVRNQYPVNPTFCEPLSNSSRTLIKILGKIFIAIISETWRIHAPCSAIRILYVPNILIKSNKIKDVVPYTISTTM